MKTFTPCVAILPRQQKAYWPLLRGIPAGFVLYGGTALALRRGHRPSVDFDFFSSSPMDREALGQCLPFLKKGEVVQSKPNTWSVISQDRTPVKFSFFGGLQFGRVGEPERCDDNGVAVASLLDLAAQKVKVIQVRAESKDYRDLAELIRAGVALGQALGAAKALYPEFAPMPSLRALSYFKDGDLPSLPKSIQTFLANAAVSIEKIPVVRRLASSL